MDARERRRVLEALAQVEDPVERAGLAWQAVQQVEVDEREMALIQALGVMVRRMGEGAARELLAKLGWWLLEGGQVDG